MQAVLDFLIEEQVARIPVSIKQLHSKALGLSHGFAVPSNI